jgi:cytochrome c peroxidase
MWRCVCVLVVVAGCWSDEPQVNGFTPEQWDRLSREFTLPSIDPCRVAGWTFDDDDCVRAAQLGQQLFWEPALSGTGQVSCVTCHDPGRWFIDSRTPNNVSESATGWTKRNTPTLINVGYKFDLAPGDKSVFTWSGKYKSPGAVLDLAITSAMGSTHENVADVVLGKIVLANSTYESQYAALFPGPFTTEDVFTNVSHAFEVYLRRLVSRSSKFDDWLAGDESAISESAQRGFQIFVGKGGCLECHNGPLLSDLQLHVTGVAQSGEHVPAVDPGRNGTGAFVTQSLRGIAMTGPYVHDGKQERLADVVEFYRRGGDTEGYAGTKDPRIVPLDLTDDDARDLVAFLETLTGDNVPGTLQMDIRPGATSCGNTQIDPMNCGSCGHACTPAQACEGGMCIAAGMCPLPLAPCGNNCFDLANDPTNCGACGHTCATYCMGGVCGS